MEILQNRGRHPESNGYDYRELTVALVRSFSILGSLQDSDHRVR